MPFAPKASRTVFVLAVLAVVATASPARAQTYTWDPTLSGTASGGGAGTWNTATANWFNGVADVPWPGGTNLAVFGGASGGLVTVAPGGVSAGGLTFNTTG